MTVESIAAVTDLAAEDARERQRRGNLRLKTVIKVAVSGWAVAAIALPVLKGAGLVTLSWWWMAAPVWVPGFLLLALSSVAMVYVIGLIVSKRMATRRLPKATPAEILERANASELGQVGNKAMALYRLVAALLAGVVTVLAAIGYLAWRFLLSVPAS